VSRARRSEVFTQRCAIDWLGRDARSSTILATVQRLMQVQRVIRQMLPGTMGAACQVARMDANSMTLTVPSAAHAAKLRQMGPAILRRLAHEGWAVTDIHVKITMQPPPSVQASPRHGVSLGPQGLQAFSDLASTLQPGPLADAVARLLAHHRAASSGT